MKQPPTDLKILETIYDNYYSDFAGFNRGDEGRESKILVPIDIEAIAQELGVDRDIVFGRLYYHLDKKYGYWRKDGTKVSFFVPKVGKDLHCVNFPLMASVLAGLREEDKKYNLAMLIAAGSLLVAIVSLAISIAS